MDSAVELYSRMLKLLENVFWQKIDRDVDYHVKTVSAILYTWEFLMHWIPTHAGKFEPGDDGDICDHNAFIKRFRLFLEAVNMTDKENIHGKYLAELLEIKGLLGPDGERAYLQNGRINIVTPGYLKDFWNNYVMRNGKKAIKKREEVFWLILACVYYFGDYHKRGSGSHGIDRQKSILLSSNKKDNKKDVNEPIRWCIGCYADICFLPDWEREGRKEDLIKLFGRYEYMGGLFDFSQHFMYRENHIETYTAEMLKTALRRHVGKSFAANWADLMVYIENPWQYDVHDCEGYGDALKGICYRIGKGFKKPQKGRSISDMSEETPRTLEGIKEYFPHNQDLYRFLEEPKYNEIKHKSEDKDNEICLLNYKKLKTYLYKRVICSFLIRLWPSKETYESLLLTDLALGEVVSAVYIPANGEKLVRAERAASRIIFRGDGGSCENDDGEYSVGGEDDGIQNPEKVQSIMERYIVT